MWWSSSSVITLTQYSHWFALRRKKGGSGYKQSASSKMRCVPLPNWLSCQKKIYGFKFGSKRRRDKLLNWLAREKSCLVNWFRKEVRPAVWLDTRIGPSTGSDVLSGPGPDLAAVNHRWKPANYQKRITEPHNRGQSNWYEHTLWSNEQMDENEYTENPGSLIFLSCVKVITKLCTCSITYVAS